MERFYIIHIRYLLASALTYSSPNTRHRRAFLIQVPGTLRPYQSTAIAIALTPLTPPVLPGRQARRRLDPPPPGTLQ
jgi:hypothetical protein